MNTHSTSRQEPHTDSAVADAQPHPALASLYTVNSFISVYGAQLGLTEQSLRWKVFKRQDNGLADAGAILQFDGRVFIDAEKFAAVLRGEL